MSTKHLSPKALSDRRLEAVKLRLDGHTVAETAARTGLSAPTVSAAWKAFREGGWEAVPVRPRGRKAGQVERLHAEARQALAARLAEWPEAQVPAWSSRALSDVLEEAGQKVSPRAIDHWLEARDLKPEPMALEALERKRGQAGRWYRQQVAPVLEEVGKAGGNVWQGGVRIARPLQKEPEEASPEPPRYQLYLHGKRGVLYTRVLTTPPMVDDYLALFQRLLDQAEGKPVTLVFHGAWFDPVPEVGRWLQEHPFFRLLPWPVSS
ncbi:helix-turn-helix domain-containing protein [Halomonas sp.]|uniref:helix-turn-helix domain-containing protein n=1 Tax=Halomonas sp. TaxID=1486246 RepID=UPI00262E1BBF|nr:helix-turn-helix domain-containing protein [Halomonas sp.]